MASCPEKLLEEFEAFEQDLEVETILKKVKVELLLDEGVSEFGERLKEREQLKQAAQTTRAAYNNCRSLTTNRSVTTIVLPPTDLRVVRGGS